MKLTVVSREAIWAQGKLLCEMTDGTLQEFTHYRNPVSPKAWGEPLRHYLWRTREQLIELCREDNTQHLADCRARLHDEKVFRFGHDYASRGY